MPAKDLGTKFTCFKCGTKFYDLKKPEPICPKCGADQRQSQPPKSGSTRKAKEKEPAPVESEVEETLTDEDEGDEDEVSDDEGDQDEEDDF